MAHIVYGVSGEGSGHSSRSREIIHHLQQQGHVVKVASYGRGYANLKEDFDVMEIAGLRIVSEDNRISASKTIAQNFHALTSGHDSANDLKQRLFKEFKPQCVITDFEPMTAYLANYFEIPLISLDNQHRMRYMDFPCPLEYRADALLVENLIRAMIPRPCVSLITTFYQGRVRNERSFLFPPILRREVLDAIPRSDEHILVYLTAGYESLLDVLRNFRREQFVVYGYSRSEHQGNVLFQPFSREQFLQDLAGCKGVIATAGFTLMTEAFHLGKPYCAFPMKGQFEQILNGLLLEELGYGISLRSADSTQLAAFLYHIPDFAQSLQRYPKQDNQAIQAKLDELLADDAALLQHYHKKRQISLSSLIAER
jgi:uncharacterized protein (TIGR00661 family)